MTLKSYMVKLVATLALIGGVWAGWVVKEVLILIFVAFILASAIQPAALALNRRLRLPLALAVILIFSALLGIAIIFIALVIPPLISEIIALLKIMSEWLGLGDVRLEWIIKRNPEVDFIGQLREYEDIFSRYGQTATTILVLIQSTITSVILTFTVFVLSYYIIASRKWLISIIAKLYPHTVIKSQQEAEKMLDRLSSKLGGWVRGRAFVMTIIGVVTYVSLSLMGVPYALALALIAGLLEIIPHFGPIIAAIPAILVATFMVNPLTGLLVMIFYTLLQQLESGVITPQVMKHAVDVQPLTTVFLVLIGLHLMGVAGGVISLPLYICLRIIYRSLAPHYRHFLSQT